MCCTRYLIGFSPYRNGSYLLPVAPGSYTEWMLYCSCGSPPRTSRWNWDELQRYEVSSGAHHRGYGPPGEIIRVRHPRHAEQ